MPNLVTGLSNSAYWNVNNLCSDQMAGANRFVTPSLALGQQITIKSGDAAFLGSSLTDAQIGQIVSTALTSGALPTSAAATYIVVTSQEISEGASGGSFCAQYCGWHRRGRAPAVAGPWPGVCPLSAASCSPSRSPPRSAETVGSTQVTYTFVGQPPLGSCYNGCSSSSKGYTTPNTAYTNGLQADAMASVLAHELDETASDPYSGSGWYNTASGNENGDLCAYNYGSVVNTGSFTYNVNLTTGPYLIQQARTNMTAAFVCKLSYMPAPVAELEPDHGRLHALAVKYRCEQEKCQCSVNTRDRCRSIAAAVAWSTRCSKRGSDRCKHLIR